MSRMNNQSRSLKIISRANGWDPDNIEGFGSLAPVYHERETPFSSDTWPIPAQMTSPQMQVPNPAPPAPRGATPSRRTNGSNPFPGMPGAR